MDLDDLTYSFQTVSLADITQTSAPAPAPAQAQAQARKRYAQQPATHVTPEAPDAPPTSDLSASDCDTDDDDDEINADVILTDAEDDICDSPMQCEPAQSHIPHALMPPSFSHVTSSPPQSQTNPRRAADTASTTSTIRREGPRSTGVCDEFANVLRIAPLPLVAFCITYGNVLPTTYVRHARVSSTLLTICVIVAHFRAVAALLSFSLFGPFYTSPLRASSLSSSSSSSSSFSSRVRVRNMAPRGRRRRGQGESFFSFSPSLRRPYWKLANVRSMPFRIALWSLMIAVRLTCLLVALAVLFVFVAECGFSQCIDVQSLFDYLAHLLPFRSTSSSSYDDVSPLVLDVLLGMCSDSL